MKHPLNDEFMMPVPEHLYDKLKALENISYIKDADGTYWATAKVMSKLTGQEYFIVNEDFDPVVRVDYEAGIVHVDERGGWSRTYSKSFADLEDLAETWEVEFDVGATTDELAEIAYKLIYAQHAVDHGLPPDRHLPMPSHEFIELPPLPDPKIEGGIYHEQLKIMYTGLVHFTAEQMIEYGKACVKANKE